jgi:hypothetical protein
MKQREELVKKMIEELCSRGGFDDWWHNIDEDIQEEIIVDLANIINKNK